MAFIVAETMFLQSIFTLRPMFADSVATAFFNNQPFGYETTIPWNDSIETAYVAGRGTRFTTAFTGDALGISPRNIETGTLTGQVEGIFTYTGHRATSELVHSLSIWGINVSLSQIQRVALSTSTADDLLLLEGILAGRDVIRLGASGDQLSSFGGNDVVFAGSGSDRINGGAGADRLLGQNDHDTLIGADGDDTIIGGRGADVLNGGTGSDVFIFDDGHTRLGIGARDTIQGWSRLDVLDFSLIDADINLAGDQRFGAPRSPILDFSQSHCITVVARGADLVLQFEVNADGLHDMELVLAGRASDLNIFVKDWETLNLIL